MIKWMIGKLGLSPDSQTDMEYIGCIRELAAHPKVQSMKNYVQHGGIDCFEHCLYVSYISYLLCRRFGLDPKSAAWGGLLHDFFLYDWHDKIGQEHKRWHGLTHPHTALRNANSYFEMNERVQDIIVKHMWPLTLNLPRYKESYIIAAVDKYCTFMEFYALGKRENIKRIQGLFPLSA